MVQKTKKQRIATMMLGEFTASKKILKCPRCKKTFNPQELQSLVPERCNFGYDVITFVGKALFLGAKSEKEIINELKARNIKISEREISYLGKKFIVYLALAHKEAKEELKQSMAKKGGYVLHLDGTSDGDSPHLMTGLDSLSEIVLGNIKVPSEKEESITPLLEELKRDYGNPLACVHDMGKGILNAIEKVFPGIPDFICHFHFLRDIGKDLFEKDYALIRKCFKNDKTRSQLQYRLKSLEKFLGGKRPIIDFADQVKTGKLSKTTIKQIPATTIYSLIQWALDNKSECKGYGYPFDLPHLIFYRRLRVLRPIFEELKDLRFGKSSLKEELKDNKPFLQMFELLKSTLHNKHLNRAVGEIEEKVKVFEKLRKAMRIALPEDDKGLNDDGDDTPMTTIKKKVTDFYTWLEKKDSNRKKYKKLFNQLDKYWDKLFTDPIEVKTANGIISIQPQRTNNILERFFRGIRRDHRRKSGNNSMCKALKAMLADTPLVKNLENEEYLSILLGKSSSLEERFAAIDANIVRSRLNEIANPPEKLPANLKKLIRKPEMPQEIRKLVKALAA